jgi:hypothetical protein
MPEEPINRTDPAMGERAELPAGVAAAAPSR